MTKELQALLIQIAKIALENKASSDVLAKELGLSEEGMDALYDRVSNQAI